MKRFLILFLLVFAIPCFADDIKSTKYTFSYDDYNLPYYTKFYNYSRDDFNLIFQPIGKENYQKLTKQQKKEYKIIEKYEKYLSKGNFYKVIQKDNSYLPAYFLAYYAYKYKGAYNNAVATLERLITIIETKLYLPQSPMIIDVKCHLVYDYHSAKQYNKTILLAKELLKIVNNDSDNLSYLIASSYYNLNSYNEALLWANKVKCIDKLYAKKQLLELKYMSNYNLKRYAEANKIARVLYYSYSYPDKYTASLRISATSSDNKTKMKFYNIARQCTNDVGKIWLTNILIAKVDDDLLNQALKTVSGFVKKPNWSEIVKRDNMDMATENIRFNKFHSDLTNCISKYKGNTLKSCLNSINEE